LCYLGFTLVTLAYFLWGQPVVLARLVETPAQPDVALGVILLAIQLLEIVGVGLKFPAVAAKVKTNPGGPAIGQFIVAAAGLAHMGLVTPILSLAVLNTFGYDLKGEPPLLLALGMIVYIIGMAMKDILLARALLQDNTYARLLFRIVGYAPKEFEFIADLILTAFSALAYTVTWEWFVLMDSSPAISIWERILEYLGAVVLFCMVFPATQPLYIAQEWLVRRTRQVRIRAAIRFLLLMVAAISIALR
jgi:hypothetical protein